MKMVCLLGLLCSASVMAQTASTAPAIQAETLVLASAAVEMPRTSGRTAIEMQNLGPNPIYCAFTQAGAVATKARRIAAGETWALDIKHTVRIWCIAGTADQVTGAATIVTELR